MPGYDDYRFMSTSGVPSNTTQFMQPGQYGSNNQTMMMPGSPQIGALGAGGQSLLPGANAMAGAGLGGGMGMGGSQGWFGKIGGMEGLGSIAQGLASLGQVYGAIQGNKMAKEQMNLTKEAYNTNLANTTKSYNTNLEDRVRARYAQEGRPANDVNSYLAKHSM